MSLFEYMITRTLDSLSALKAITRSTDPQNARRHALESTARGIVESGARDPQFCHRTSLLALGPQPETVTSLLELLFTLTQTTKI